MRPIYNISNGDAPTQMQSQISHDKTPQFITWTMLVVKKPWYWWTWAARPWFKVQESFSRRLTFASVFIIFLLLKICFKGFNTSWRNSQTWCFQVDILWSVSISNWVIFLGRCVSSLSMGGNCAPTFEAFDTKTVIIIVLLWFFVITFCSLLRVM